MTQPPFRHILTIVDGSESSFRAVEYALRLARACAAQLTAVSIVDTATLSYLVSTHILMEVETEKFEHELEVSGRRHLSDVADLAREHGVKAHTVLLKGPVHTAVLAEQKSSGADLIVIGAFGCSLCQHSVVAREGRLIVDEAPCAVLIVR